LATAQCLWHFSKVLKGDQQYWYQTSFRRRKMLPYPERCAPCRGVSI
jgi:hypothetical protein